MFIFRSAAKHILAIHLLNGKSITPAQLILVEFLANNNDYTKGPNYVAIGKLQSNSVTAWFNMKRTNFKEI